MILGKGGAGALRMREKRVRQDKSVGLAHVSEKIKDQFTD
jgi:hypothetical protein